MGWGEDDFDGRNLQLVCDGFVDRAKAGGRGEGVGEHLGGEIEFGEEGGGPLVGFGVEHLGG